MPVSVGGADGAGPVVRPGAFAVCVEERHADPSGAAALHADLARGGVADVDPAAAAEGTPVVDADDPALAVGEVGDAHMAAKGKGAVGGGQIGRASGRDRVCQVRVDLVGRGVIKN